MVKFNLILIYVFTNYLQSCIIPLIMMIVVPKWNSLFSRIARLAVVGVVLIGILIPSIETGLVFAAEPNLTPAQVDLLNSHSHWQLAGVTPHLSQHRLDVKATGTMIVNQDGSFRQLN